VLSATYILRYYILLELVLLCGTQTQSEVAGEDLEWQQKRQRGMLIGLADSVTLSEGTYLAPDFGY
jgi:hypothetical protein